VILCLIQVWRYSAVIEHLPSMHKSLGLIPNTGKIIFLKKKPMKVKIILPGIFA
jgi:hypothetical protein